MGESEAGVEAEGEVEVEAEAGTASLASRNWQVFFLRQKENERGRREGYRVGNNARDREGNGECKRDENKEARQTDRLSS